MVEFASALPWPRLHDSHFHHPVGTILEWPIGFDYAWAWILSFIGYFDGGIESATVVLPFASILAGLMAVGLFHWGAVRLLGPWIGTAAGLTLAANLALRSVAVVGELDHHATESLTVVLLLAVPFLLGAHHERRWLAMAVGAMAALLSFCSTVNALLVILCLSSLTLFFPWRYSLILSRQLTAFATGFLVPFGFACSWESAARGRVLALTTLSLAHFAAAVGLLILMGLRMTGNKRTALVFLIAMVSVGALALGQQLSWTVGFVSGADGFWGSVSEALPLLLSKQGITFSYCHAYFGWTYLILPAMFVLLRRPKVHPGIRGQWLFLLGLFVLSFAQKRFVHVFAPAFVLVVFSSFVSATAKPRIRTLLTVAAALLLFEPLVAFRAELHSNLSPSARQAVLVAHVLEDVEIKKGEGVAAPPNMGNAIVWLTGLPVVSNTFFYREYLEIDLAIREARTDTQLLGLLQSRRIGALVAADDIRYRAMLLELFGRVDEAQAQRQLGNVPCQPRHLEFAYDRAACGVAVPAQLGLVQHLVLSTDLDALIRQVRIYQVHPRT